jgi:hypothetical protein
MMPKANAFDNIIFALSVSEQEMGQWVMGHGSNGSPKFDGSHGSMGLDP